MADKAFIIREAQKYLAKGQIDKAIAEWENLLASFPDANSYNAAGDLYLRKNDQANAIEKFHRAAEIFRKEGFSLKALAIYKKILNIVPFNAKSHFVLGELSEEKNIIADAVNYYMTAADIFLREGRKDEAVYTFSRINKLQPDNLALRKKLAGIFSKEGFVEETSQEYVEIARLLEGQGQTDEAVGYLEKAVEIKPGNRAALTAIASLYERLGDRGRAIEHLKLAIARTGKSDIFLLWLAKLCLENGDIEGARQNAGELLQMDPENLAASQLIAASYVKEGRMKTAWAEYEGVLERLMEKEKLPEAIGILEEFRQAEPILAAKRLAALYRRAGRTEEALGELKELAGLLKDAGDAEGARLSLREALDLAPEDGSLKEKLRELGPQGNDYSQGDDYPREDENPRGNDDGRGNDAEARPAFVSAPAFGPTDVAASQTEEDADRNAGEGAGAGRPFEGVLKQADRFIDLGLLDEARRLLEPLRLSQPANMELHLKLKSVYLSAGDKELAVTECIIMAELLRRAGREPENKEMISEAFRINPTDARLVERWGVGATGVGATTGATGGQPAAPDLRVDRAEYSEKLSEAAFYMDQGLYGEAEKIYNEFLARSPEDRNIKAKLAELSALKSGPDAVIAASGNIIDGGAAKVSAAALEGDIEKIFEDFKKGVEKQLDPGDAEARYNLGIAYKEMGLLEDAERELKSILDDPEVGLRAASVLAACYMERGRFPHAIETLRRAIQKADPGHEIHWGLKYDLAAALEKNSAPQEALNLYTEIHRRDPEFRDTASRMEILKKAAPQDTLAQKAAGAPVTDNSAEKKVLRPAPVKKNRISYI